MVVVNGRICRQPLRELQIGDVITFATYALKRKLAFLFLKRVLAARASLRRDSKKSKFKNQRHFSNFRRQKYQKGNPGFYQKKHKQKNFGNKNLQKSSKVNANKTMRRFQRNFSVKINKKQARIYAKKNILNERKILARLKGSSKRNKLRKKLLNPLFLPLLGGLRQYNLLFLPKILALKVVDKAYLVKNVFYPNNVDFDALKVHFKGLS